MLSGLGFERLDPEYDAILGELEEEQQFPLLRHLIEKRTLVHQQDQGSLSDQAPAQSRRGRP